MYKTTPVARGTNRHLQISSYHLPVGRGSGSEMFLVRVSPWLSVDILLRLVFERAFHAPRICNVHPAANVSGIHRCLRVEVISRMTAQMTGIQISNVKVRVTL